MQFLIDIGLLFIYLCLFLLMLAWMWRFWKMYVNQKYLNKFNADCILLEIKLPREIFKTPLAAEMAISSLLQSGGVSTWYAREFSGNLPQYASLEIASLEGEIHFYARLHKKFKELVVGNFYAHYPGIEIVEADDYTKKIRYHHLSKDVKMWGTSFKLSKTWNPTNPEDGKAFISTIDGGEYGNKIKKDEKYKMPADFYPIKTYVDYGLDKPGKEEEKIDPITGLLEVMGGIGKGEYFWYQVIIQDEGVYNGDKFPKTFVNEMTHDHVSLSDMAKAAIAQIRTSGFTKHGDKVFDDMGYQRLRKDGTKEDGKDNMVPATYNIEEDDKGKRLPKAITKKEMDLTPDEKEKIEMINKKMSKPLALTVVRLIYVTNGSFNANHVNSVLSFPKPFKGENGFAPKKLSDPYDFNWQKIKGKRTHWRAEEIFEEYVEREGFFPHIKVRGTLDKIEDEMLYPFSMKTRKMIRMIYEGIFHPFDHPHPDQVSIMNLEEIATLWHLPGQVANPPSLPRIDSVKGTAPSNLPI